MWFSLVYRIVSRELAASVRKSFWWLSSTVIFYKMPYTSPVGCTKGSHLDIYFCECVVVCLEMMCVKVVEKAHEEKTGKLAAEIDGWVESDTEASRWEQFLFSYLPTKPKNLSVQWIYIKPYDSLLHRSAHTVVWKRMKTNENLSIPRISL